MKAKAYWKGHEIYIIGEYSAGWAKIAFWNEDRPITGTGGGWVDMDEMLEFEDDDEDDDDDDLPFS